MMTIPRFTRAAVTSNYVQAVKYVVLTLVTQSQKQTE